MMQQAKGFTRTRPVNHVADFPHVTKPARTYSYYLGDWDAANANRLNDDRAPIKKNDLALVLKTR